MSYVGRHRKGGKHRAPRSYRDDTCYPSRLFRYSLLAFVGLLVAAGWSFGAVRLVPSDPPQAVQVAAVITSDTAPAQLCGAR